LTGSYRVRARRTSWLSNVSSRYSTTTDRCCLRLEQVHQACYYVNYPWQRSFSCTACRHGFGFAWEVAFLLQAGSRASPPLRCANALPCIITATQPAIA